MNPEPIEVPIPDGSFVESEVRIITYRGDRMVIFRMTPDVDYANVMGSVYRVTHLMLHDIDYYEGSKDDD